MSPLLVIAAVSLPFLVVLARRPVLRRLAFRYGTRRPLETLLLLVGSTLGTAVLTGSLVVGDTFTASLRDQARTQLGPVDEVVTPLRPEDLPAAESALRGLLGAGIDGVAPVTTAPAACATGGTTRPRAEPHCQLVELDFAQGRALLRQGDVGLGDSTPAPGTAAISTDLAETLGLRRGDAVRVLAYDRSLELRVGAVLPPEGLGSFWTGPERRSPNVFLAPGTVGQLAGGVTGLGAPQRQLLVSNEGGVFEGATHTDAVLADIEKALGPMLADTRPIKQERLDAAATSGRMFSTMLAAVGLFIVLAGLLLVVNVFAMLAEDRRSELGMLRALGVKRRQLVGAFASEGWAYAMAAAAVGSVLGLGVSRLIVLAIAPLFAAEGGTAELVFAARPSSLVLGFAVGVVIVVVTVLVASVRTSRLNVIRAIRQQDEPPRHLPPRLRRAAVPVAIAAGGALTAVGVVAPLPFGMLLGPLLAGVGVGVLTRFRPGPPVWAAAGIAWSMFGFPSLVEARPPDVAGAGFGMAAVYVVQGLVLIALGIALVAASQTHVARLLRRLAGGRRTLALHLGLAHPTADRFRTAMTLAMYALVVFTLTFVTVFSGIIGGQVGEQLAGAADVVVRPNTTAALDVGALAQVPGVDGVAPLRTGRAAIELRGQEQTVTVGVVDAAWAEVVGARLLDGAAGDAEAAFASVLADEHLALVDPLGMAMGGGGGAQMQMGGSRDGMAMLEPPAVGDRLVVRDPVSGNELTVTVAGTVQHGLIGGAGVFVAPAAGEALLGDRLALQQVLLTASGDPEQVAAHIAGATPGVDAQPVAEIAGQFQSMMLQLVQIIQAYLALGLVVGIAGLAIVMVRAVRERRRHIGALRAIGFPAATVRRAFLAESGILAGEGALVGMIAALTTARAMLGSMGGSGMPFGDLSFTVPVPTLAVLLTATLAVSLVATLAPARAAARIRPAVALRVAD